MSAARADDALALRVTVVDAWRVVPLALAPAAPVGELKRRALEAVGLGPALAAQYEVKVGGALVRDEAARLDAAGVESGSHVVVLSRRRRAVR